MPLQILKQDITKLACDVIVDPTDPYYSGSGGTDLAIHTTAGTKLDEACRMLDLLGTGEVAVTEGYDLPARYVIHTVGPIWRGGGYDEPVLLRSCYLNALFKAEELGAESVAFPLIASGTFGFPKEKVMKIALEAISDFLRISVSDIDVAICVFSPEAYELSEQAALDEFIEANRHPNLSRKVCAAPPATSAVPFIEEVRIASDGMAADAAAYSVDDLSGWLKTQDDGFALTLLKLIDVKKMTDVQCYKKANVSRKTFWKIVNDGDYRPSKATVIAFAVALELSLDETEQLLQTVGYSLSHSNLFDMIIEFYIRHGIYDVFVIDAALYKYDQPTLGC